jgi:hypothetical protein
MSYDEKRARWYHVRRWTPIVWAGVISIVIIIVVAIVVPVIVVRNKNNANAYPDYVKLNYSLHETCESGFAALKAHL